MSETLRTIWDEIIFYGPAAYSILAVLASGLVVLLILFILWKRKKDDVDKNPHA